MAKIARYAGRELQIVNAVIAAFGGKEIWNQDLASWLRSQFPDVLGGTRAAENFLEAVGMADFASAHSRTGKPRTLGYAAFRGVRRHRAGEPAHTEPRARYWVIPSRPYTALLTKQEVFARLGAAVPRPLPTKERTTPYHKVG